jgi:hypothetical protein
MHIYKKRVQNFEKKRNNVQKMFNKKLPASDFVKRPTISAIAKFIASELHLPKIIDIPHVVPNTTQAVDIIVLFCCFVFVFLIKRTYCISWDGM